MRSLPYYFLLAYLATVPVLALIANVVAIWRDRPAPVVTLGPTINSDAHSPTLIPAIVPDSRPAATWVKF